ncbi:MAG: phosphatidate cytidylyltransferase [Anaerolineae bacterium]|nr:phosphatidate cytidylyltransferase [Anaerolineae bacterium]
MSRGDIWGLIWSYVYAFGLLFIVEAIGKRFKWEQGVTRKIIHIGAGLWIWGILSLFDHWYYGIIPFATFIVLNAVFYRQQSFKAMDTSESTPGTVYFAVSITILFALLWRTGGQIDRAPIAAAAVMAMTLGDAFASIVGSRWGRHPYTFLGHQRSWEGTAAMAAFSLGSILLTLFLLPASALSPDSQPLAAGAVLLVALAGTAVATTAEALSPAGTDNLSVPLLSGLAMVLASRLLQG